MKKASYAQLREDVRRMEAKWLRADEAAHQARLIVEAVQKKYQCGDEGDATILIDAAKVILDRYAEDV